MIFSHSITRLSLEGTGIKLYKKRAVSHVRATFFSERVINVWNSLPKDVDFSSLLRFKHSIQRVDFSIVYEEFLISPFLCVMV